MPKIGALSTFIAYILLHNYLNKQRVAKKSFVDKKPTIRMN